MAKKTLTCLGHTAPLELEGGKLKLRILADRTNTRWGIFRPWFVITAAPWCVFMFLAYSTPAG